MGACTTLTQKWGLAFAWCRQLLVRSDRSYGHGRMHSLSVQSTGTMHVPFLSQSGYKRPGGCSLRTTMNLCRTLCQKMGVCVCGGGGGCYAVGVYSALYGGTCTQIIRWKENVVL